MSDTLAMPLLQGAPSTGRNWIKANVIAALIAGAGSLAAFVVDHALGVGNAGVLARIVIVLAYVLGSVAGLAAYAVLAGRVLREKLLAFPMRIWIVLHVAAGLLIGIAAGYSELPSPTDSQELTEQLALHDVMINIIGGSLVGGIVGLAVGSFQALIMRRRVRGLGAWIGFSGIAGLLSMAVLLTVEMLVITASAPTPPGVTGAILMLIAFFFAAIITAIVMLPAVARLTPR